MERPQPRPFFRPPPPSPPPMPSILITDHTQNPPLTTHYHNATVHLDFRSVYLTTKRLLCHPPCPHRPTETNWPCPTCCAAFASHYWTAAASLLDYFADFHVHDTVLMGSLWFHLLDVWQESYLWHPVEHALRDPATSVLAVAEYTAARWVIADFTSTLGLFDKLLHGPAGAQGSGILHDPTGEKDSPAGRYETGPWVSGLDGWAQFLGKSGPGVVCAVGEEDDGEGTDGARYIPQPAIALIKTHTQRARRLAKGIGMEIEDAEFLHRFDENRVRFPKSKELAEEQMYRALDGQMTTYRLVNGAPPIMRYSGYGDASMTCDKPTMNLLDECVALCRGVEAYEPVSGEVRENEDDEGSETEDEDEEVFDMWAVTKRKEMQDGAELSAFEKAWMGMLDT